MSNLDRRAPVWLSGLWEHKKIETADRVRIAIERLTAERQPVTVNAIRDKIKEIFGVPFSANTIKRNEAAYALYLSCRQTPRCRTIRDMLLRDLYARATDNGRRQLHAKVARLRRESKDRLIARLIGMEEATKRQTQVENRLREEIIRTSLQAGVEHAQITEVASPFFSLSATTNCKSTSTSSERRENMKTERLTREFRYLGMLLADPDPAMTPEQVRDCYCHVYPEITTAVIEGPEPVENKLVFRFTRAIGSKG